MGGPRQSRNCEMGDDADVGAERQFEDPTVDETHETERHGVLEGMDAFTHIV